jgi:photosystem II stability/assembly factor-like uncharacterized protein
MRSIRRLAVASLCILAACGTAVTSTAGPAAARRVPGLYPGLRYNYAGQARLAIQRPPASAALPGASDLLATPDGVLAATSRGIWRSTDSGVTWQPVLTGLPMWSLAKVPGGYAANGNRAGKPSSPVLAVSTDGVHWKVEGVAAPRSDLGQPFGWGYRFALSGLGPHTVGIAVSDLVATAFDGPALRSTDGGRHWTRMSLRAASNGVSMLPGGRVVFVTAPGDGSSCQGAVYRSTDSGAHWQLLAGSCQPYPLTAVQFLSARQGFAAGGMPAKFNGGQVVEATDDGGLTWHTREFIRPGVRAEVAIVRLDMLTATRGWALAGGCVLGQNGPCGGGIEVTADGGHSWFQTSQVATSLAGLGGDRALAGDDLSEVMASTSDDGRHWSLQSPPSWVESISLSGTGPTLLWLTTLGPELSTDAGRSWTVAAAPPGGTYTDDSWLAAPPERLLGFPDDQSLVSIASDNGGRTWTSGRMAGLGPNAQLEAGALGPGGTAIAVASQGGDCPSTAQVTHAEKVKPGWKPLPSAAALFSSVNGGDTWRLTERELPFGVDAPQAAVSGSHLAIIDACNRLQLSRDGGRRWDSENLGKAPLCMPSAWRDELWLACSTVPPSLAGGQQDWVLHSSDGGSTWTLFRLPAAVADDGRGQGAGPATDFSAVSAIGHNSALIAAGGSLWRSTDGGARWTQSWPVLDGD